MHRLFRHSFPMSGHNFFCEIFYDFGRIHYVVNRIYNHVFKKVLFYRNIIAISENFSSDTFIIADCFSVSARSRFGTDRSAAISAGNFKSQQIYIVVYMFAVFVLFDFLLGDIENFLRDNPRINIVNLTFYRCFSDIFFVFQ